MKTARPTSLPLDRIRYAEGQALRDGDLQRDAEYEALLRELHVRAVHDVWGVVLGFEIQTNDKGDGVAVGPGFAYDRPGRELVWGRSLALDPPPKPPVASQSGWLFDLVVRHAEVAELAAGRDANGTCIGAGGALGVFEERPIWRWCLAGPAADLTKTSAGSARLSPQVKLGVDVPLARFVMSPEGLLGQPDLSLRRNAHGLVRPHVAGGRIRQGTVKVTGTILSWSVPVDTSSGGFTVTPFYFASLADHPLGDTSGFASELGPQGASELAALMKILLGPFVTISGASGTGFTLEVRMAVPLGQQGEAFVGGAGSMNSMAAAPRELQLPVPVNWLGVEWVGGCEPTLQFQSLVTLGGLFLEGRFRFSKFIQMQELQLAAVTEFRAGETSAVSLLTSGGVNG